ncbi:hypothetical protein [Pedobacter sp. SYP-B3415]|uniref:hypothetical protein n=1 Tax=Pedobacter sp. SYP-B3415 TaxID=2496641 RepID=UPI0013EC0E20|nr:hypothetical protein [Pedobacter sp. SYP-B3415]
MHNTIHLTLPAGNVCFYVEPDHSCHISCGRLQFMIDLDPHTDLTEESYVRLFMQHNLLAAEAPLIFEGQ